MENNFTMVAKDDNGNNVPVPGLILNTEEGVRRFARSIARQEQAKHRTSRFKTSEFKINNHLDSLKSYNVKVELFLTVDSGGHPFEHAVQGIDQYNIFRTD